MNKKRGIYQNNPKDPSPVQASLSTGFRSSENQSNAAKVDGPKTSEYAFFKKVKTDASQRFNSHHLHKAVSEPNKFKSCDFPRDQSSRVRNSSEDFKMRIEDGACVNRGLFLTPNGVDLKRASTSFQDVCSPGKNMEESRTLRAGGKNENLEALCSETWLNDVNFPRNHNMHEDLFSEKRQKLHQWVADISFPEIEELCSKGYDFVSVLLSRLFPESNEENTFQIRKSERVERVSTPKLLASPHSNNQLKEHHCTSTRNFMEVERGPYLENGSSACCLDSLREETFSSDSSTCHAGKILLDYNLREPSCELIGKNKISWIKSDSASRFFKNHGHIPSAHIRELDDFCDPGGSFLRREQHPLLLEWNSEKLTNERTSLVSQNTELIKYRSSLTSFPDDPEWSLHEFGQLGASELRAQSVICKYSPNMYSLPPSHSTSYSNGDCGREYLEEKEDLAADLSHYPLRLSTLSCMPSYPNLTEGCHDITCEGSRTFLSPGNHHWLMREVSSERHDDPNAEAHFSSELDFELGRECLPISDYSIKHFSSIYPALQFPPCFLVENEYENRLDGLSSGGILGHFGQDMVHIDEWSSLYFQIALNKEKACALLLDKSSWNASEGELYHEDSGIEYL